MTCQPRIYDVEFRASSSVAGKKTPNLLPSWLRSFPNKYLHPYRCAKHSFESLPNLPGRPEHVKLLSQKKHKYPVLSFLGEAIKKAASRERNAAGCRFFLCPGLRRDLTPLPAVTQHAYGSEAEKDDGAWLRS
jgi:hypothetical protein